MLYLVGQLITRKLYLRQLYGNRNMLSMHTYTALTEDYSTTSMTVSFGSADHSTLLPADINRTFTSAAEILIVDDELLEDAEDLNVLLTMSGVSGSSILQTVIILDNEGAFSLNVCL